MMISVGPAADDGAPAASAENGTNHPTHQSAPPMSTSQLKNSTPAASSSSSNGKSTSATTTTLAPTNSGSGSSNGRRKGSNSNSNPNASTNTSSSSTSKKNGHAADDSDAMDGYSQSLLANEKTPIASSAPAASRGQGSHDPPFNNSIVSDTKTTDDAGDGDDGGEEMAIRMVRCGVAQEEYLEKCQQELAFVRSTEPLLAGLKRRWLSCCNGLPCCFNSRNQQDKNHRQPPGVPDTFVANDITTSKYTLNPFLPSFVVYRNLFEQFHRLANVYFLIVAILQLIPGVSPTGQFTTLLPLSFVMLLSMCKDGFEDYKRHVQDRSLNNSAARVLRAGVWRDLLWREVAVGDILEVRNKRSFPADMVLLSSTEADGICYIETSSLDGETNLKLRKAAGIAYTEIADAGPEYFSAVAEVEGPNNRVDTFSGTLYVNGKRTPLNNENVVLRGAALRNTAHILGLVVYTGSETKLMMNAQSKRHKMSNMDVITNRQVLLVFFLQLSICALSTIGLGAMSSTLSNHWYLAPDTQPSLAVVLLMGFVTFLILYNNLIPISLYVSMEMVKLVQAYFINCDVAMYHEATNTPAQARTSSLNEELGQVSYVFSDKTGTLTCNIMEFLKFSCVAADGKTMLRYGSGITEIARAAAAREGRTLVDERPQGVTGFYDPRVAALGWQQQPNAAALELLLCHLAVCHTVVLEEDEKTLQRVYQAASPDEACLVKAAELLGVVFTDRTENTITIAVAGIPRTYELLNVIQFDSTRKRMSTVVRTPEGRILVLCKGADSVICERLQQSGPTLHMSDQLVQQLTDYACEGLRTLVLASAELEPERYRDWAIRYEEASCAIVNRDEKVARVGDEVEWGLSLVGATAIEDKLQGGVPDTIELLVAAGIKVWVLTGDKQETAINIAFACALLNNTMTVISFDDVPAKGIGAHLRGLVVRAEENAATKNPADIGLVIQGHLLGAVLEDPDAAMAFVALTAHCKAVVCCRVSPLQKAQVVSLVKDNVAGSISLAIGDGANDVSMIQAAHVGVGISGLEGLQAARASDYSIAQFRFLQELLLIHGRWSYRRIARIILYSFYKNIALYLTQLWFCFVNGFSGESLLDNWALALYNVSFTAFPIMIIATLDRDVERRRLLDVKQFPELYLDGLNRRLFSTKRFWMYVASAILHSLVAFLLPIYMVSMLDHPTRGYAPDIASVGMLVYTCVLFTVTLKAALETLSWTVINVVVYILSVAAWFVFLAIYTNLYKFVRFGDFARWYGVFDVFGGTAAFWLLLLLVVVIAILRDFLFKYFRRHCANRELSHVVQIMEHTHNGCFTRDDVDFDEQHLLTRLETLAPRSGTIKLDEAHHIETGFAFAQEGGQGDIMRVVVHAHTVRKAATKLMAKVVAKRQQQKQ